MPLQAKAQDFFLAIITKFFRAFSIPPPVPIYLLAVLQAPEGWRESHTFKPINCFFFQLNWVMICLNRKLPSSEKRGKKIKETLSRLRGQRRDSKNKVLSNNKALGIK